MNTFKVQTQTGFIRREENELNFFQEESVLMKTIQDFNHAVLAKETVTILENLESSVLLMLKKQINEEFKRRSGCKEHLVEEL